MVLFISLNYEKKKAVEEWLHSKWPCVFICHIQMSYSKSDGLLAEESGVNHHREENISALSGKKKKHLGKICTVLLVPVINNAVCCIYFIFGFLLCHGSQDAQLHRRKNDLPIFCCFIKYPYTVCLYLTTYSILNWTHLLVILGWVSFYAKSYTFTNISVFFIAKNKFNLFLKHAVGLTTNSTGISKIPL